MATYNSVFAVTRYKSIEAANKTNEGKSIFNRINFTTHDGKVYRCIWSGAMRGKIKDFILEHKTYSRSYGSDYNGYGWSNHNNDYYMSESDGKSLLTLIEGKKAEKKPAKTEAEKQEAWCKRLVKLLSTCDGYEWVTMDVAREIAQEKVDYKEQQIRMVEDRQYDRYSVRRQSLINKMERENPLRRIEDEHHAICIIQASNRHNNSDYEDLLEEYRSQAQWGMIDHADVKAMARQNYTSYQ